MKMKRAIVLLLTLCMIFSIMSPAASAAGQSVTGGANSKGNASVSQVETGSNSKSLRDDQSKLVDRENMSFVNGKWVATISDGKTVELTDAQLPKDIQALRLQAQRYSDEQVVCAFVTLEEVATIELYAAIHDVPAQLTTSMLNKQDALIAAIENEVLHGAELNVVTQFTHLTNSIVIETEFGNLQAIAAMAGVKSVFLSPVYEPIQTEDTLQPTTASSTLMTGVASVWQDLGYTGKGMTIAILDTGLDVDHPSFAADPEGAAWTVEWLQSMMDEYDLRLESISKKALTAEDLYYNAKVPFTFNYATGSTSVIHNDTLGDHGTHVAGISAANKLDTTEVVGMAPDAQIIAMKVFSPGGGASMHVIIEALQDCMILGVDVVNMSLGSPAGFSETDIPEIDEIFARIAESDMIVDIAAGNEGTSSYSSMYGNYNQLTDHIENSTMSSPATYANAMAVASVDNNLVACDYFELADGTKLAYMYSVEYLYGYTDMTLSSLDYMGDMEYVVIEGLGYEEDFYDAEGNSLVEGKIAVIRRGEISFHEKSINAEYAGAIGVMIWNSDDSNIFNFGMTTADEDGYMPYIPVVLITLSDGQIMADAEVKTLSVPGGYMFRVDPLGGQMSSFSSWGTTSDLRLLPDIAGIGGNVFSCYDGGNYGIMSGTSMACPQVAGVTALLLQYLKEQFPEADDATMRTMADALLMSTAIPIIDADSNVEASPRQQGAGLVNALGAISAEAYLSVQGSARPKAELKDNADGEFTFTFTVHNFAEEAKTYNLRSSLLCEDVVIENDLYFMAEMDRALNSDAVTFSADEVTVEAGGSVDVTVTIKLTEEDKQWIDAYFPNGNYVEGYIYLEGEEEVTLVLPFMGFYGEWDQAPVFDDGFWYENGMWAGVYDYVDGSTVDANMYYHMLWVSLGGNDWVLGMNPYTGIEVDEEGNILFSADNLVLSPNGDGALDSIFEMYLSLMRNAEVLDIVYTDAEGNELDAKHFWKESKTMYISSYGQTVPFIYSWTYDDFYDFADVEDGDVVYLTISGSIDYEGARTDVLFDKLPIYIDTTAPVLDTTTMEQFTEDGRNYISMTITEEHPAAVITMNKSGTQLYEYYSNYDMQDNEDGTYTVILDVTGLGDTFTVAICDFGCNETMYDLVWAESGTNNPEVDTDALYAYQVYDELMYYYYGWDAMFGWTIIDKNTSETTMISSDQYEYYALTAAEYVDGYVFAIDAAGNFLYMTPGLWNRNVICNIGLNVVDMAFDDTTGTMYLATSSQENYEYALYTLDLLTGEVCPLTFYDSQYDMPWAMTFIDGTLYCTRMYYGGLYTVDLEDEWYCALYPVTDEEGNEIEINGSNGSPTAPYYAQSMTYSEADGLIYWAYYNGYACDLVTIDPADWSSTASAMFYDQEFVGLLTLDETEYKLPEATEIVGVAMTETQVIMGTGNTHTLVASALPWNAPAELRQLTWSSSDEDVVIVEDGVLTAISEGTAYITVSCGDYEAYCEVAVVDVSGNLNAYRYFADNGDYGYWLNIDLAEMSEEATVYSPVDFFVADYNGHTGIIYGFTEAGQCYWFNPETEEYGALGVSDPSKIPADMAYDYSTGLMYAIVYDYMSWSTTLYALDMNTGKLIEQAVVYDIFVTLACSTYGQLYAISYDGALYELYVLEGEGGMGGGGIMPWSDDDYIDDDYVDDDIGYGDEGESEYYIETWYLMQTPVYELNYAQSMCYDHNNQVLLWSNTDTFTMYWLDALGSENPFAIAMGNSSGSDVFQYMGLYVIPEVIPELEFFPVTSVTADNMVMLEGQSLPAALNVKPLNATSYSVYYAESLDGSVAYYDMETGMVVAGSEGSTMICLYVVDNGEDLVFNQEEDAVYMVIFDVTVKKPTDNIFGYLIGDLATNDGFYWIELDDGTGSYEGVSYVYYEGVYMMLYSAEHVDGTIYAYGYDPDDYSANFQFLTIDAETWSVTSATDMGAGFSFVYDMAFDYTTGTMYAVAGPSDNNTDLYYVNLANGQLIECMSVDPMIMSITVDANGTIYGMSASEEYMDPWTWETTYSNAILYTLDPTNGTYEPFMDTGVMCNRLASMAYDFDTGYIYWTALYQGDVGSNSGLYLIDLEEMGAYKLGTVGSAGAQVSGLIIFADEYPEIPDTLCNVVITTPLNEIAVNTSIALDLFVQPFGLDATIEWNSADEAVATVDENGVVTGVAAGTTTITATVSDGVNTVTTSCVVIVYGAHDYFITYNHTDGGFALISRPDSTIVTNFTEREDAAPVTSMAMIDGVLYAFDEEGNFFTTSVAEKFQRNYLGNHGIEVREGYTEHKDGYYVYDYVYEFDFVVRDMAWDAVNNRLLAVGVHVLTKYVTYTSPDGYSDSYVESYELDGGCALYAVDLQTGALEELVVIGGDAPESGVSMLAVTDAGEIYIYTYYMDYVMLLDAETGYVEYLTTFQNQGVYGSSDGDLMAMTYDAASDALFLLFTSNGTYYKLYKFSLSTQTLTEIGYVGDVVYQNYYYSADCFAGLVLNEDRECMYELTVSVPASCTQAGYDIYTCMCGDSYVQYTGGALGHYVVMTSGYAPTCTDAGLTNGAMCYRCGAVLSAQSVIPALGHDVEVIEAVAPTCVTTGLTAGERCARCEKILVEQQEVAVVDHTAGAEATCTTDQTCTVCAQVLTPALGHTAADVVVENNVDPTCTATGSYDNVVYCSVCNAELSRETVTVKENGHTAGATGVENNIDPTCTEGGSYDKVVRCTVCNEILSSAHELVAFTGHTWGEGVLTAEAGCENPAVVTYTCVTCGRLREVETDPATGHNYTAEITKEATETEEGQKTHTCVNCGDVQVESIGKLQISVKVEGNANTKLEIDNNSSAQVDPDAELVVEETDKKAAVTDTVKTNVKEVVDSAAKVLAVYDINLVVDGASVQPGGEVMVTIPAPANVGKNDTLVVVYVDDNGNVTPCETVRNADGTLTFVTNHFSYYAVVVVSPVNVGLIVGIVIAVCAAAAVAFIVLKKKRG